MKNIQAQLHEWDARIELFKAEIENSNADKKIEYNKKIDELQSKKDEISKKLKEFEDSSDEAWESFENGLQNAWDTMDKAIDSAIAKFK